MTNTFKPLRNGLQAMRMIRLTAPHALLVFVAFCSVPASWRPQEIDAAETSSNEFQWPIQLLLQKGRPWRIQGAVHDHEGNAIHGARVVVSVQPAFSMFRVPVQVLGQARSDGDGAFRLHVPGIPSHQCAWVQVVVGAPGYGLASTTIDAALDDHNLNILLAREQPIRGQLIDNAGRPAAGVRLRLKSLFQRHSAQKYPSTAYLASDIWQIGQTTDEQGRFELNGAASVSGEGTMHLAFDVDDERYAPEFNASLPGDGTGAIRHELLPSRIVEGVVSREDTGAPMSGAGLLVVVHDSNMTGDMQWYGVPAQTDEKGQFAARCGPGRHLTIYVYPPSGEPYPAWVRPAEPWPDGVSRQRIEIPMRRGLWVRGRVIDGLSGVGVQGAGVEYHPQNAFSSEYIRHFFWAAEYRQVFTTVDGSYQIAVLPGPGKLLVKAPSPDYVSTFITIGELQGGDPDGMYYCVEGMASFNLTDDSPPDSTDIELRRGTTVSGRVQGPNGERIASADVFYANYQYPQFILGIIPRLAVRDGGFVLRGVDPSNPQAVLIFDRKGRLGASITLDPNSDQTVRLTSTGSAGARLVDANGQPWSNHEFSTSSPPALSLVVVAIPSVPPQNVHFTSLPDVGWPMVLLNQDAFARLRANENGEVTFPELIPAAKYRLYASDKTSKSGQSMVAEFRVESGRCTDLGTLIIQWSREARD